jgi:hypothetical protein
VTTATVSGWMKRLCMEILLKRRYVLSKSDNNRLRHHECSEMGDVQRCPPFYYVQDTPVCHRFSPRTPVGTAEAPVSKVLQRPTNWLKRSRM